MRSARSLVLLMLASLTMYAAGEAIPLWPGAAAPGEKATSAAGTDTTSAKDNKPAGKSVIRLGNVTEPTLSYYPAPESNNTHAAVLVFPGGGYRILAYDLEGTEICEWLNTIGVNAVLVKYRVPQPADVARYKQPLQDAQRAMGLVRSKAMDHGIDPGKIGVLGFSAGGHLLAVLGNSPDTRTYPKIDDADAVSSRPDFVLLVYPAYLSEHDEGETLAAEVKPSNTPPTFIVQAEDDSKFIGGTLLYYHALQKAKVPAELHVYSRGGHGYGMRPTDDPVTGWPHLAEAWLRRIIATTKHS